jgi:cytochrome c
MVNATRTRLARRRALTRMLTLALTLAFALTALCVAACRKERPLLEVKGGFPELGRQAIARRGCGGCHYVPGVAGAEGKISVPLFGFGDRPDIAGAAANTPEALVKWLMNPQSVAPSARMPNLGVNEKDARDIAAYLYTLKSP